LDTCAQSLFTAFKYSFHSHRLYENLISFLSIKKEKRNGFTDTRKQSVKASGSGVRRFGGILTEIFLVNKPCYLKMVKKSCYKTWSALRTLLVVCNTHLSSRLVTNLPFVSSVATCLLDSFTSSFHHAGWCNGNALRRSTQFYRPFGCAVELRRAFWLWGPTNVYSLFGHQNTVL